MRIWQSIGKTETKSYDDSIQGMNATSKSYPLTSNNNIWLYINYPSHICFEIYKVVNTSMLEIEYNANKRFSIT